MTPDALPAAIIEPAEARDQLGAHGFLLAEALPLLGDDLGRRPLGEVRPRQLRPGEPDALVDPGDLLLDPLALRRRVDDARQLDVELRAADDRHGRAPRPRRPRIEGQPDECQRVEQPARGREWLESTGTGV